MKKITLPCYLFLFYKKYIIIMWNIKKYKNYEKKIIIRGYIPYGF